jgi:hypothetical protein
MSDIKPAENAVSTDQHQAILRLEAAVLDLPQTDLRTEHALSGQVYARTIHIPANTVLTGATHKKDHVNIVCGDITVTTDQGPVRITGYHVIATKAGSKRAGFAHADTTWTTICQTALDDIEAIEDELVEESASLQTRKLALPSTAFTELEHK